MRIVIWGEGFAGSHLAAPLTIEARTEIVLRRDVETRYSALEAFTRKARLHIACSGVGLDAVMNTMLCRVAPVLRKRPFANSTGILTGAIHLSRSEI